MAAYSGVFKKSIEVTVSAKKQDSDAQNALVFFNPAREVPDVAYGVELTEGVSVPFELKLTILTTYQPSRTELKNDLLFSKYTVTLRQDNEKSDAVSERVKRERKFKGIVTSYAFKGSVPSAQNSEKSCYVYELTIEPELVLLSLKKRTCHYSGMTVIEIIKELFKKHDLQSYCEIDLSHFGQDKFDDKSFVFEQNQENDLEFLNRLLRQFSINYCFDDSGDDYKVTFSRSGSVYSHFPVATQNDTTKDTVVNAIVNPNLELKVGDNSYIFNAYYKGSSLQGSIYSDEDDASFSDEVESNLNTDIAGNSKQLYYINESHNKIRNTLDEYLVLSASDLVFASGVNFLLKDESSCFNNCQCLIVRSYLKFNVAYPSYFASSEHYEKTESTLTQKFVAIPIDNATDAVLGPIGVFKKLENVDLHSSKDLDSCFGLTKVSESRGSKNNQSVTVTGVVCNAKGEITDDNEVNRIALESNQSNYDKFYVKVSNNGNDPSVVICSYLSSYLGVNNLPKLGQKVVMLFTGSKYYLLGILPKETIGLTDEAIQNKNADSVLIKNNDGSSAISLGAMTDIKSAIREKLLSHELSSYVGLLNIQNNSLLPKENFETEYVQLSYKKAVLSNDEDTVTLEDVNKLCSYKDWSEILPDEIKAVESLKDVIAKKLNAYELQKDLESADKQRKYYDLCKESLNSLVEATKEYSTKLEEELHKYISLNKGALSIKSKGSVKLSSTLDDGGDKKSIIDVSANEGVSIQSSLVDGQKKSGQVNINADGKVTIKSEKSIVFKVGNSSITIDTNGIAISSKKLPQESLFYDSSLTVDSMGNVKISAFDTSINSFSSNTISDAFGGKFSTMAGKILTKGNFVNIATQKTSEIVDCVIAMIPVFAKLTNSIVQSAIDEKDPDKLEENQRYGQRTVLITSDLTNLYANIMGLIRNIGATRYSDKAGNIVSYACACIVNILKIVDLLEDIVVTTVDMAQNEANNEFWEKRDKSNDYISNRDIFKLVTSTLSKTAFIASSLPALIGAVEKDSSSSLLLIPDAMKFASVKNVSMFKNYQEATTPVAGKDVLVKDSTDDRVAVESQFLKKLFPNLKKENKQQ